MTSPTTPACLCPHVDGHRIVRVGCPAHTRRDQATAAHRAAEVRRLLIDIAAALSEVYDPAGVLTFWSSRVSYLDDRRPSDLVAMQDLDGLERLAQRARALADGAFS